MAEHKAILEGRLSAETDHSSKERTEILLKMAQELEVHAAKKRNMVSDCEANESRTVRDNQQSCIQLGYKI